MKLTLTAIATGLAVLITAPGFAGGPALEDTAETVAPRDRNNWILPVLGIAVLAIIAGQSGGCYAEDVTEPTTGGC